MRIALVCRVYPTQRPGGMAHVCQDRAHALVRLGHEVHVLTTGRTTHKGEELDDGGVQVHHMPCKPMENSDAFAEHCVRHCRSFLPHVLHLESIDIHRPWWQEFKYGPIACTMHGFCWGAHFTQWNLWQRGGSLPSLDSTGVAHERKLLATFGTVIGISRHEHWQLYDLLNLRQAKLVYNPIPDYFFKNVSPELPKGKRRILCAAVSGQRERGFDIARRAANGLDMDLVEARDVPREGMPAIIDSCHALVLPTSYSQGCDLAVAESLARCRPVIATGTGSYYWESESDGIYTGVLKRLPLTDTDALAAAMVAPIAKQDGGWADWRWQQVWKHGPDSHAKYWLEAICD